jgi:hypothetical protein
MLTLNSTTVKSPRALSVEIMDITGSRDTNAAGLTLIDRLATKRKLDIEWGILTGAEMSAILTAVSAATFSVTYPDPQTGVAKTITCYVDSRVAPMVRNTGGVALWEGLEMTLIEQ